MAQFSCFGQQSGFGAIETIVTEGFQLPQVLSSSYPVPAIFDAFSLCPIFCPVIVFCQLAQTTGFTNGPTAHKLAHKIARRLTLKRAHRLVEKLAHKPGKLHKVPHKLALKLGCPLPGLRGRSSSLRVTSAAAGRGGGGGFAVGVFLCGIFRVSNWCEISNTTFRLLYEINPLRNLATFLVQQLPEHLETGYGRICGSRGDV